MKNESMPQKIEIRGKELLCPHCDTSNFTVLHGQLETLTKSGWQYELQKHPTTVYVCATCSHISEFLDV